MMKHLWVVALLLALAAVPVEAQQAYMLYANGCAVSNTCPLPVTGGGGVGGGSVTVTPGAVTLTTTETSTITGAAAGVQILAANASRKFLRVVNDNVGNCRVGYGSAPTATTGEPLAAAAAANQQGGSITFESSAITQQSIWAYCVVSSTLSIVEGQ